MFSRLSCRISESSKLNILLRNIQPFYQNQLGLFDITTIDQLKTLCRILEACRQTAQNFVPSSRKNALEPDLAYVESTPPTNLPVVEDVSRPHLLCFKCDKPGHKAIGCLETKQLRCYRCKRVGFTSNSCPDCSRNYGSGSGHGRSAGNAPAKR